MPPGRRCVAVVELHPQLVRELMPKALAQLSTGCTTPTAARPAVVR